MANSTLSTLFTSLLMEWHQKKNKRKMPWKGIKDPYKIWLSEIILQQTRVEQGLKYYEAFVQKYPTVSLLAKANEEQVFKLWQGLGYYNRCRNMLATAKIIETKYGGKFPKVYADILGLKGIGEYTAAAIASFAYNMPYAVVDGNVVRVLSRVFALNYSFFEAEGKKKIRDLSAALLDKIQPALYNQAIMDLGAMICKPQNPICEQCPMNNICVAQQKSNISLYPIKKKPTLIKERFFQFIILETPTHVYLTKRTDDDIWKELYTPYCIETKKLTSKLMPFRLMLKDLSKPIMMTQMLSHQKINGIFYTIQLSEKVQTKSSNLIAVKKANINQYAFPRMIASYFEKYKYL